MQIISIIILVVGLSLLTYKTIELIIARSKQTTILTPEQKQLKWSKLIYFACSAPILYGIFNTILLLGSRFQYRMFGSILVDVVLDLVSIALLYGFLMLNYNFIKVAYKRNIADKKTVVFFSCLPGLLSCLLFIPQDFARCTLIFIIVCPMCNAYILSQGKKQKHN